MTEEKTQIDKIMKWTNYVSNHDSKLQPILNDWYDRVKKPNNEHLSIKEAVLAFEKWKKDNNHTPPVGFIHQHIFNQNNPYDVVDELVRHKPHSWNAYHMPAMLYTKLSLIQRYKEPKDKAKVQEIKDYNKKHGKFDPQARCVNCYKFIHLYYKNSKKIVDRTEKMLCDHEGSKKIRLAWDAERSKYRAGLKEKAAYKAKQAEKAKRHKRRSAVDG